MIDESEVMQELVAGSLLAARRKVKPYAGRWQGWGSGFFGGAPRGSFGGG